MGLEIREYTKVADTLSGRRHGRVKQIIRQPKTAKVAMILLGYEPVPDVFVVEWTDGLITDHSHADLVARYTTQSKDWKPEKYGKEAR